MLVLQTHCGKATVTSIVIFRVLPWLQTVAVENLHPCIELK
jgi:hypothetical protein